MNSTTIAVDVAKAVFEVAVSEHPGQVRERHRFSRERFRRYLGEQPPATILMEACGSAHYWGRQAQGHGHRVTLLPPHVVRPYVPRNKTDRTDAKGLLEAARNDEARPVPVKSESQQAVAALHRLRSTWLATRTARINTVRGLLREFGVIIPTGARHVVPAIGMVLEDIDAGVPRLLRPVLAEAAREIRELEARLRAVDLQLDAAAQQMPVVERLRSIPGLGLLTTTALGPTLRKLPRPDAPRAFDRPAPTTRRHQQAWGSITLGTEQVAAAGEAIHDHVEWHGDEQLGRVVDQRRFGKRAYPVDHAPGGDLASF
jgi:transposase